MSWSKVEIKPKDYKGWVTANALRIKEEFKTLGFYNARAFINIVTELSLEDFGNYDHIKELEKFWHGRYHSEEFNKNLQKVLEKLKAE